VFDDEVIEGTDLNVFSNLFSEYCQNGVMKAYLVSRTVAVFEKAYQRHD
jgi:ribosomal protein L25 (general stress protein Ctc)